MNILAIDDEPLQLRELVSILQRVRPQAQIFPYPNLRTAPCRYDGSAYDEYFVIAAHNYRTHFGRLADLTAGSEVRFTDVENNVFIYQVECIEILEPTDIEEMVSDHWDMTLFTCTYGGQARVAVRCLKTSY